MANVTNVTWRGGLLKLLSVSFLEDKKKKINEIAPSWHTVFANPWQQARMPPNSALQKADNYWIQSKDCFYLPAANGELPLNPRGLASVTMPKHLRSLVSAPEQQVMRTVWTIYLVLRKKKEAKNKAAFFGCLSFDWEISILRSHLCCERQHVCVRTLLGGSVSGPKRSRVNVREVKGGGHVWCLSKTRFCKQRERRGQTCPSVSFQVQKMSDVKNQAAERAVLAFHAGCKERLY